MNNKPIGVFDSGLGGLTAVKELCALFPHEDIIYFGDTARVPYGTKSPTTVLRYACENVELLQGLGVKVIVAACGTVSSLATLKNVSSTVPFFGVVEATSFAAAKATRNGRIGVIGTSSTIASNAYSRALHKIEPNFEIFEKDCPLFVPLVENGLIEPENPVTQMVAAGYLDHFSGKNIDTLILGCTHYPIIAPVLEKVLGKAVTLINSGRETARHVAKILRETDLLSKEKTPGKCTFFVSDSPNDFAKTASIFLGRDLFENVKFVPPFK